MYSEDDIRKFFSRRGEIELKLGVYRAQFHNREDSMPINMRERIDQLERDLMTIDSLFHALSANEKFVIQAHVIEQLDWPQVLGEFVTRWGTDSEKTIRSLQVYQTKGLKKVANILNRYPDFESIGIK